MKRFIEPDELARDSRFIRQDNAMSTMLASMPDDVDAIVAAFENFSPMIEASVRGTAAQELFDAYGPGFGLVILNEPLDPGSSIARALGPLLSPSGAITTNATSALRSAATCAGQRSLGPFGSADARSTAYKPGRAPRTRGTDCALNTG